MHLQKVIESLGYKRNEAKVYLAALSLGEAHISDIATKVKLPRSSVQVVIDKLHRDGLVNFYVRKRYKYWVAENPKHLLEKLRESEEEVLSAMPYLEALRHGESGKPSVKVFEGVEEIKLVYDDVIETKQHIAEIVPWDDWVHLLGRGFMDDFIEKRVRRFLRIRLLTPRTALTSALHSRDARELRQTRFIPKGLPINSTTFIYGTKVAIISLNKKLPTCILVDDPGVRDTLMIFFEELWERSRADD